MRALRVVWPLHLHIIPSDMYLFYTITNEALQLWDITYEALQV